MSKIRQYRNEYGLLGLAEIVSNKVSVVFWPPVQSVVERRSFSCGEALS
jgi:hypothetical protein